MKKILSLVVFLVLSFSSFSQDTIRVKNNVFETLYSQNLEQPLWIKYRSTNRPTNVNRGTMDFYTEKSIKTSDGEDYRSNVYDKGHMAPAADFNCTREMLYKTFSYLNCSLQNQDLNRTTWRLLEVRERLLAGEYPLVVVEIDCIFSKTSIRLSTGATVPDGYYKTIRYGNKIEKYYFKNDKPSTLDYSKYLIE